MINQIILATFTLYSCVFASTRAGVLKGTSSMVVDLEYIEDGYHTVQVDIGSNN